MRVRRPAIVASAAFLACCAFIAQAPTAASDVPPRGTAHPTGDPSPLYSTVICRLTADPTGGASTQAAANKGTIALSGRGPSEDIRVEVVVRGNIGQRLAGATVVASAQPLNGATFRWDDGSLPPGDTVENPRTGVTDAAGEVVFIFDEGGVALSSFPLMPDLDFALTTQGPGPGDPQPLPTCPTPLQIVSFDLNADGVVNLTDFAIFASDYGAGNPRSDFNWDGHNNLVDLAQFAAHYLDSVDAQ